MLKYSSDSKMLPQELEPINLLTINNDCKEIIFDHLGWLDLLNIADTSKQLYLAVCHSFKRKYGNAKIDFGGQMEDR